MNPTAEQMAMRVTVRDWIRDHPEKHDQEVWLNGPVNAGTGLDIIEQYEANPNVCGTTGCVAGWAAMFAGYKQSGWSYFVTHRDYKHQEFTFSDAGMEALGLNSEQADILFDGNLTHDSVLAMLDALVTDSTNEVELDDLVEETEFEQDYYPDCDCAGCLSA